VRQLLAACTRAGISRQAKAAVTTPREFDLPQCAGAPINALALALSFVLAVLIGMGLMETLAAAAAAAAVDL
jgi:hypothetical protein